MIGLVDGNNFYVSCERVVNPKLNGKPVAVLSNNDGCCVAIQGRKLPKAEEQMVILASKNLYKRRGGDRSP